MNITFRRDPECYRPRINKFNSVKDKEQKEQGLYFYYENKSFLIKITNIYRQFKHEINKLKNMKLFDIFKTNSTLKNEDLQKIKEETDFNQKEIKKSHKKFVALDKDKKGFVSTNDLASIPEVENNPLRYHIAQHMSDNKENGAISFESFIKVIDIFKNNKTDEQFRFMYNLFDIDNDGKISRTDMFINFKLLLGDSLNEKQIKEIVDKIINEYSNDKEYLYYMEFKNILNEA